MLNRFALLAAILVTSGYAANQTANAGNLSEVDSDRTDLTWQGLSVDKLEDMDLYNAAGTKIGEVEDVLADGNGKLSAVGVEFTGIPSADDKELVVPLDRLHIGPKGHLTVDLSETEIAHLAEWDD